MSSPPFKGGLVANKFTRSDRLLNMPTRQTLALTFTWPRPGAVIAADTVTVRGWLDDATATLTAEWVDPPGQTNECVALVERHGRFWLRGLPLSAGTNEFILKAVDAWTNTLVTNLTLVFKPYAAVAPPDEGDLGSDVTRQYQDSNYGETETALPNAAAPADSPPGGPYEDRLTDLLGTAPNGSWRLFIVDDSPSRSGFLLGSWCLNIQTIE